MLDEWSDALGKGDWRSTGPKSYAYEIRKGKGNYKMTRFMLNFLNAEKLNMKSNTLW